MSTQGDNICPRCGVRERRPRKAYCLECRREVNREYYKNNEARMRSKYREAKRIQRLEVLKILGGKCVRCGFDDPRALQIDHINGGGAEELRDTPSRHTYMENIKKMPAEERAKHYQLLCANCNWIKRDEQREWSHVDKY